MKLTPLNREPAIDEPDRLSLWLDQISRLPGWFVTGTDTGVGKTWIGVRLMQLLRQRGMRVIPRKPVESGWLDEQVTETDSWRLAASGSGFQPLHAVCPNRLQRPLSPPRAALLEGRSLQIADLAASCLKGIRAGQFVHVEGAGGFYSPLAMDGLNADLAQALKLPVLLVTEDRVGCINHVLLTLEAIRQRGLAVAGVMLNPIRAATPGMDNLQDLRTLLQVPVLRWPD
ncbi:MAG TPA: dethiobiotin synthase [Thiolinea sp.]|nr:dethiobiotin synthase [Thiolinea sp.]